MTTSFLLYLYAESPLHAGAPESANGLDQPIQREVSTDYPVITGQSLKGAMRRACYDAGWGTEYVQGLLGAEPPIPATHRDAPEDAQARKGAATTGSLIIGDAQLVAMPVPTMRRTFAWATSALALERLSRQYRRLRKAEGPAKSEEHAEGGEPVGLPEHQTPREDSGYATSTWVEQDTLHAIGPAVVPLEERRCVEEWADRIATDCFPTGTTRIPSYFADKLRTDLILLGDSVMSSVVRECTEQSIRVQLDEDKKVAAGPFTSEYLPTETILATTLSLREQSGRHFEGARDDFDIVREVFDGAVWQIGGDTSIGKGWVWSRLVEETK